MEKVGLWSTNEPALPSTFVSMRLAGYRARGDRRTQMRIYGMEPCAWIEILGYEEWREELGDREGEMSTVR